MSKTSPQIPPRAGEAPQRSNVLLIVIGLVAATAPGWLFAIAGAFAGIRTAALLYGIPVLASTVLAIWCSVTLRRGGSRGAALTVGIIALVVGVIMYVAWAYVAGLGIRYGDGPL